MLNGYFFFIQNNVLLFMWPFIIAMKTIIKTKKSPKNYNNYCSFLNHLVELILFSKASLK